MAVASVEKPSQVDMSPKSERLMPPRSPAVNRVLDDLDRQRSKAAQPANPHGFLKELATDTSHKPIVIPPGEFAAPHIWENNFHPTRTHEFTINGRRRQIELIHQQREGDCILANFLNTTSVEINGTVPIGIDEARQAAIEMRRINGDRVDDILQPDSPLSYRDVVNLFSSIHGVAPKQEDILTVEGRGKSTNQVQLDALTVLDLLDTYHSGLVATGLGYHSRSIKKLAPDHYAIIDPMDQRGLQFTDQVGVMHHLASRMQGQSADRNFFFFVRDEIDADH